MAGGTHHRAPRGTAGRIPHSAASLLGGPCQEARALARVTSSGWAPH
ncbi:hypothetical protein DB31_0296 [Hyalangium minutum]|uniref:Uncharacterized protein n=1 Tax=Hyalangium minutum TaxID=394096 RepID=A0A085WWH2_9BACT|nr:hypothetical protein DB31_0296 [Hyalangium minutum]